MDVVVIGGGVVGASVAFRLAQAGAGVTLLESQTFGSGTSNASFAWLNANNKAPLPYHLLNVGGMAEHAALRHEFGSAPWLHMTGNVAWDDRDSSEVGSEPDVPILAESLSAKIQRLRSWGYPLELITRTDLAGIEPELIPPPDIEEIAYFPTEGYIDVPLLVARLMRAARACGAQTIANQQVVEITQSGGRVTGVRTAGGTTYEADYVVSCAGRWTDQVTELVGRAIPMKPTRGLLVISSPVATELSTVVQSPAVNLRPDGGSRVMMASFGLETTLRSERTPDVVQKVAAKILQRATAILPALEGAEIESARVGVRALPADRMPVVGPHPEVEGLYILVAHSGVTMGPLLGRVATREILSDHRDERFGPFRPGRFFE